MGGESRFWRMIRGFSRMVQNTAFGDLPNQLQKMYDMFPANTVSKGLPNESEEET